VLLAVNTKVWEVAASWLKLWAASPIDVLSGSVNLGAN
jgi:hypothetical protein